MEQVRDRGLIRSGKNTTRMAFMVRIVCKDFDEFVEALPDMRGNYVLRTRQARDWRLRVVELDGVTLATGREGAGRIYNGVGKEGYYHVFMRLDAIGEVAVDGHPMGQEHIAWMLPQRMFHARSECAISWLGISISVEHLRDWAFAHEAAFDFTLTRHSLLHRVEQPPAALFSLAHRLFRVDAEAPEQLQARTAKAAARTQLLDATFRSLLPVNPMVPTQRRCGDRMRILRRALRMLESLEDSTIRAEDLCQATGASERTIRNVFNDYLGMSPHRYLMLHRLHAIRAAIRCAGPSETLTSICSRYGVWDFGRLSRQYREHFGDSPSQTLRNNTRLAVDRAMALSGVA